MFEAYINELRLLRRRALDLDPGSFQHIQTSRDPDSKLSASSGWTLWAAGIDNQRVAIAWPWGLIRQGIPAIDPMQIQSNLLLLDPDERPMTEYQALGELVHVVNRLEWHAYAQDACGEPSRPGPPHRGHEG